MTQRKEKEKKVNAREEANERMKKRKMLSKIK